MAGTNLAPNNAMKISFFSSAFVVILAGCGSDSKNCSNGADFSENAFTSMSLDAASSGQSRGYVPEVSGCSSPPPSARQNDCLNNLLDQTECPSN